MIVVIIDVAAALLSALIDAEPLGGWAARRIGRRERGREEEGKRRWLATTRPTPTPTPILITSSDDGNPMCILFVYIYYFISKKG